MLNGGGVKKGSVAIVGAKQEGRPYPITDTLIVSFVAEQFTGIDLDGDIVTIKGQRYFINVRDNVLVRC